MTSSTSASTVNIPAAQIEPMKASGVPASGSQPRWAAQLIAAGAVKVRIPATTPIRRAHSSKIIPVPPTLRSLPSWLAHQRPP